MRVFLCWLLGHRPAFADKGGWFCSRCKFRTGPHYPDRETIRSLQGK